MKKITFKTFQGKTQTFLWRKSKPPFKYNGYWEVLAYYPEAETLGSKNGWVNRYWTFEKDFIEGDLKPIMFDEDDVADIEDISIKEWKEMIKFKNEIFTSVGRPDFI